MSLPKKITGIILAAGSSSRMGKTKQLMPFKGDTLLGHVIQNAKASSLNEIIVVIGHHADKINKTIDLSGTKVVRNHNYSKGQSTSLLKGIENASTACDAAMFLLADQPLVTPEIIDTLIDAFERSNALITIPYCKGKRGNPVIINKSLFPRLKILSADTGARVLFDEFRASILKVPIHDSAILTDVDTMDDYKKLVSNKSRLNLTR
ncbi:MAG: molybdenum cofactor cytidylyltransferase [Desulfobacteraceae bacterium]|nr:molybdenum cofactor cytidylyltransferase [Desulfobacteraceae bacterium]